MSLAAQPRARTIRSTPPDLDGCGMSLPHGRRSMVRLPPCAAWMTVAVALIVHDPATADDDPTRFREFATRHLVEKGLLQAEPGSLVCIRIDGKMPTDAQLAGFRAMGTRSVAAPSECRCAEDEPADRCTRIDSRLPACTLSVGDFQYRVFVESSATLVVSCGWPKGSGEVADFELRDGQWHYTGASVGIKM